MNASERAAARAAIMRDVWLPIAERQAKATLPSLKEQIIIYGAEGARDGQGLCARGCVSDLPQAHDGQAAEDTQRMA